MAKDYYELLQVPKSSSASDIKKAYLKLAKQYHPDYNPGNPEAEKKFKEISQAYEVLKDSQKRAAYDNYGHDKFTQHSSGGQGFGARGGNPDINDIFGDFFSDFMGGGGRSSPRGARSKPRGADLKYNLTITLEEAFTGVDREINFSTEVQCSPCSGRGTKDAGDLVNCDQCGGQGAIRMQQGFFAIEQTCNKCGGVGQIIKNPCSNCRGHGRLTKQKNLLINVPAGVEDSTRIRISGEGEAGLRGGQSGDLYVFISVKSHDIFKVENNDLHFKLPLKFTTAIMGGEVEVRTIDGAKVKLKIPAGVETGNMIKLGRQGMTKIRSSMRGDMYAHVYIQTPTNLTKKQLDLVKELDKELGDKTDNKSDPGFFDRMKNIWS
jgi:molecular chaperone DnaJ